MELSISPWQTDSEIIEILGKRIQVRRLRNNVTQEQLAKETGLSKLTIKKIENGQGPKLESWIRILRYFSELDKLDQILQSTQVSPKQLFEERNKKQRQRARKKQND